LILIVPTGNRSPSPSKILINPEEKKI